MSPIDDHLLRFDDAQRSALSQTADTIRRTLPGASEVISYGMPTFKVGGASGIAVVGVEGFARHNSLFPYSGQVLSEFATQLAAYEQTKGSIHFDRDHAFPAQLLRRILRARIAEINAGYPRKSGETKQFYDNGFLKMSGRVRHGELHGAWQWFRRDGSLLRSGAFRAGVKVGEWTTYDRSGSPHKVSRVR